MTSLYFHPEVGLEITESFRWYEAITQGLDDDFISELDSAYDAIVNLAVTWPIFKKGFRRYILTRFPFAVIYKQLGDEIYVVAVMHQSRKPNYWSNRVLSNNKSQV